VHIFRARVMGENLFAGRKYFLHKLQISRAPSPVNPPALLISLLIAREFSFYLSGLPGGMDKQSLSVQPGNRRHNLVFCYIPASSSVTSFILIVSERKRILL